MDKVRVLIVGATATGKTTIAHVIRKALVKAGFQDVVLFDAPGHQEGEPSYIEQRVEALRHRSIQIEVIPTHRVPLGDAALLTRGSSELKAVSPEKKP